MLVDHVIAGEHVLLSIWIWYLESDNVLALLLTRKIHVAKLSFSERAPHLKVVKLHNHVDDG